MAATGAQFVGRAALADFCTSLHRRFLGVRHFESNVTIDARGPDEATNYSYWTGVDGAEIIATGVHEDRSILHPQSPVHPAILQCSSLL